MGKIYLRKYISFVLLFCMLVQIFIPSAVRAEESAYNDNQIYQIQNDVNTQEINFDDLKCMHGKSKHETCEECGKLVSNNKNIPLVSYEKEYFDSILPPADVDEEDLVAYKLKCIRFVCVHGKADGTYCESCNGDVNVTADDDLLCCAILDCCVHGKVKGESCLDCKELKLSQDDYELMDGEQWEDPLIYASETLATWTAAITNSGFPSYSYECGVCGHYLGDDTAWINNVHHCCDSGCETWAKPSNKIELRGTCSSHEGRVVLQGGHHLAWVQHYGSGSHRWNNTDVNYDTTEPTCTEDGLQRVICDSVCLNCGDTTTRVASTKKLDKLGHDYQVVGTETKTTEATCQSAGKVEDIKKMECSRCHDIKDEATTIETFDQLAHKGQYSYKDALTHNLECEGVNTDPHKDTEDHKFLPNENGEDHFCDKREFGCDAYKTTIHYDAYITEKGEDKLLKADVCEKRITDVYSEAAKNIVNVKDESTVKYPNTLETENGLYKVLDKNSQSYVSDVQHGGIRLKVYYEDVTPKSNFVIEHYKQVEKEVQSTIIQSYELSDTDIGEYKIGGTYNIEVKDYDGYEVAENQAKNLVISENSSENILKIYYNKVQDKFSVWIPSAIYIDIDKEGNVSVKDNPAVYNGLENRNIAIKEVKLRGVNGWSFSENPLELKDQKITPVGSKKLSITLNNDPIKVNTNNDSEASVVITPDNWVIGANSSLPLNIGAVVAAQVQDIVSNHVFTIDFVAGWDKAVSGANNYMITLAKSVEGGLIDSSIDSILAIGGNMPSIPDAVPNDPDMKFDGWFISGSDTNIKNITTISENITIEPRFSFKDGINKLELMFVAGAGGSLSGTTNIKVTHGTYWGAITKPTVKADAGYQFDGWYNADNEKLTSSTQILWSQTVTAKFNKIDMTSYFTYEGNTVTGLSDTYLNMVNAPTDLVLPDNAGGQQITTIGTDAFKDRNLITSVAMPDSITGIEANAFRGCSNLNEINLYSITSIGNYAFSDCMNLKLVDLDNIVSIGSHAFDKTGIKTIVLPDSLNRIEDDCFTNLDALEYIYIPKGLTRSWAANDSTTRGISLCPNAVIEVEDAFKHGTIVNMSQEQKNCKQLILNFLDSSSIWNCYLTYMFDSNKERQITIICDWDKDNETGLNTIEYDDLIRGYRYGREVNIWQKEDRTLIKGYRDMIQFDDINWCYNAYLFSEAIEDDSVLEFPAYVNNRKISSTIYLKERYANSSYTKDTSVYAILNKIKEIRVPNGIKVDIASDVSNESGCKKLLEEKIVHY